MTNDPHAGAESNFGAHLTSAGGAGGFDVDEDPPGREDGRGDDVDGPLPDMPDPGEDS